MGHTFRRPLQPVIRRSIDICQVIFLVSCKYECNSLPFTCSLTGHPGSQKVRHLIVVGVWLFCHILAHTDLLCAKRKVVKIPIFEHAVIKPLKSFGITHKFWDLHIDTLIYTWVAMSVLFAVIVAAHFYFKRRKINPFSFTVEQIIEFFVNLCNDSFGFFNYDYFAFIMALFTFTLFCNAAGMLPFMSEPSGDLNTALACGICSFCYVQWQKIKIDGVIGFFKEFFEPIFILFPLNVVGEFAKVASMSFRLFGNILGGSIIVVIALKSIEPYRVHFMIYTAIALPLLWLFSKVIDLTSHRIIGPILSINNLIVFVGAWLLMFFGLFEGVVQAFVITMLTVTYLSLVTKEPEKDEKETGEIAT